MLCSHRSKPGVARRDSGDVQRTFPAEIFRRAFRTVRQLTKFVAQIRVSSAGVRVLSTPALEYALIAKYQVPEVSSGIV